MRSNFLTAALAGFPSLTSGLFTRCADRHPALRTLLAGLAMAAAAAISTPGWALSQPTGDVVLTISGNVASPNQGKRAVFDMAMLHKLPQHSFSTKTPWMADAVLFSGPLLRDVLKAAGATGTTLTAVALNDYKTSIPAEDATRHDVIVATTMNGRPMPVREKGPLFIVYPFDSKSELRAELYYNRSAWQLNALQVR